ncbi:unnamed protein product, partial [Amoebophrya sp. A120]|eukprot:GSA120T00010202001.1
MMGIRRVTTMSKNLYCWSGVLVLLLLLVLQKMSEIRVKKRLQVEQQAPFSVALQVQPKFPRQQVPHREQALVEVLFSCPQAILPLPPRLCLLLQEMHSTAARQQAWTLYQ